MSTRLDKPIETLRRWRKTHCGPPSYLLGGDVRYDEDDLDTWLAAQRRATLAGDLSSLATGACNTCGSSSSSEIVSADAGPVGG